MTLQLLSELLTWIIGIGLTLAGVLAILIWKRDKTKRVTDIRILVRIAAVAGMYFLFASTAWLAVVLITIVAATLFLGRFFCGWVCPFGLYMDIVSMARESLRKSYRRLPEKLNWILNMLRYPLFVAFLALPIFLIDYKTFVMPFALYFTGPFKPEMILLGPLEPLIVPWSNGPIGFKNWSISYSYLSEIKYYSPAALAVALMVFFVAVTLVSSFVVRRFWCRFCPTGISLAISSKLKAFNWAPILHINKVEEKCTKCGICKRVCPTQVTKVYKEKSGNVNDSACIMCLRCVETCPEKGCLKVKVAGKAVFESRNWLE